MIFLPVKPASAIGPPIVNFSDGLIWNTVLSSMYYFGTTLPIICSLTPA